jgi:hypothetical protein
MTSIEDYYIASIIASKVSATIYTENSDYPNPISASKILANIENGIDLNSLWPSQQLFDLNSFYKFVKEMRSNSIEKWESIFLDMPLNDEYIILLGKYLETHTEKENLYIKNKIISRFNYKNNNLGFYETLFNSYMKENQEKGPIKK